MSRTYRKHIMKYTCYGDNRAFYACRRRKIKNLGRMQLRSLLANYDPETVSDLWEEPRFPMRDEWAEPADGHCGLSKKDLEILIKESKDYYDYSELTKKANYYIKPKNRKHYRLVK